MSVYTWETEGFTSQRNSGSLGAATNRCWKRPFVASFMTIAPEVRLEDETPLKGWVCVLSRGVESERRSPPNPPFALVFVYLLQQGKSSLLFGFGCLKAFAKRLTICRVWFLSKKTTLRTRLYVTKMCLFLFKSLRREIISCPLLKERFQSKENSTYSKIYKQLFETDAKSNSKRDVSLAEVLS